MRASRGSFLDHVKWLRRAALQAGAELLLAGDSLRALVRAGARHRVLHPRFVTRTASGPVVTPDLHDGTEGFLGWYPYRARSWPLAADPLAFARFARERGLPAPEVFTEARPDLRDVVVVGGSDTSGWRWEGPYSAASDRPLDPSRREHYQRFVPGELHRIWFWGGSAICAEPLATRPDDGPGRATDLAAAPDLPWAAAVRRAGTELLAALPREIRSGTIFTVDAVFDGDRRPWLLSMSASPDVHPRVYPAMLATFVAADDAASSDPSEGAPTANGGPLATAAQPA